MDTVQIIGIIATIAIYVLAAARKAKQPEQLESTELDWDEWMDEDNADDGWQWPDEAAEPLPEAEPAAVAPVADPHAAARQRLIEQLDGLGADLRQLVRAARVERATRHIADAAESFIGTRLTALRREVGASTGPLASDFTRQRDGLAMVYAACEVFVNQRSDGPLRRALGDIDELSAACYQPMLEFARANRLTLQSAHPVAVLTPFDLSTWTGFIPTGLAPLFLPPDFFDDIRWWPAVAHEIAHDFLAGTDADDALRSELGIPSEEIGTRPLMLSMQGLTVSELVRVFGGWFEELFCDITGALMLGPAYGYTMVELFSAPANPLRTATVAVDSSGRRYDVHPPRLLRVITCAHVLELIGEHEAAAEIREVWVDRHGEQEVLVFPVAGGAIELPTAQLAQIACGIASALHGTGLQALDGHALPDIPGLDYGPHRAAEARRARDELLSGRAPSGHKTLAVVAGAVLAWWQQREREAEFIALARRAIVGVTESREDVHSDAYALKPHTRAPAPEQPVSRAAALRESFLLHVVFSPPPSVARMRAGTPSFAGRRTWPPKASEHRTHGAGPARAGQKSPPPTG